MENWMSARLLPAILLLGLAGCPKDDTRAAKPPAYEKADWRQEAPDVPAP